MSYSVPVTGLVSLQSVFCKKFLNPSFIQQRGGRKKKLQSYKVW